MTHGDQTKLIDVHISYDVGIDNAVIFLIQLFPLPMAPKRIRPSINNMLLFYSITVPVDSPAWNHKCPFSAAWNQSAYWNQTIILGVFLLGIKQPYFTAWNQMTDYL